MLRDVDATGLQTLLGNKKEEHFFIVGDGQKNYYPKNKERAAVELNMKLSKKAHLYSLSLYMLTNWMIDMGGISRAFYFGGMIVAHQIALRAYKAALIGDVFMV